MHAESASFGTLGDPVRNGSDRGTEVVKGYSPHKEFGLLIVIDADDRVEITDTRCFPYRWICSLIITAADGTNWTGTGWLASPCTVITAGHCVYRHENGGRVLQVKVGPGRKGSKYYFDSFISTEFAWAEKWKKEALPTDDYGAIFLPTDHRLGDTVGFFGFANLKTAELEGVQVSLSGYPRDKPEGTQWYHERRLTGVGKISLHHEFDTFDGHSGAPLWRVQPDGDRLVIGIHNAGSRHFDRNHATRINDAVFQQIKDWKMAGS